MILVHRALKFKHKRKSTFHLRLVKRSNFSASPKIACFLCSDPRERQIKSGCGQSYLQWLATDEIRPSADFSWDTFLSGELDAHALGEEFSSL
jgi:hypothetical protein